MSSEWIETDWGSIATLEYGKGLRDYRSGGGAYPVYGTNGQVGHCESFLCPHSGIVVGRKGAYRGIHYSANPFYVIDTAYWLKPKIDLDLKWAYYELLRQDINSLDSGSAIPSTTRDAFYSLDVFLPPIEEQKAIAHILGTLDEKIELNRKTNETLEAMAKALFKSWFVDFDPVRAKAEGRPSGLPAEISDLFPDSFEDSELGEIPSGWSVHPLSDIVSIQGGSQPPAKTFVDFAGNGYVRLLQIRDFLGDNHLTYIPESKNLRIVGKDDVLIGRYGSGSGKFMEDSLGRPLRGLSGAINVAVVKTLPRQNNMIELIYCMVLSGWFYRQIVGGSSRAVQAGFRKEDLDLIPFPMPPNSILDAFQEIGNNFWHRTKALDVQTKSLCQIRDALLPKLISGEIRIPNAEKILEEVDI